MSRSPTAIWAKAPAAMRSCASRAARGVLQLDPSVEITGDLFTPLTAALRIDTTGVTGPWGLHAIDHLKEFSEVTSGTCDAIQGYCFATRRDDLLAIGGFDERYRFYRNLDIAMSLALRNADSLRSPRETGVRSGTSTAPGSDCRMMSGRSAAAATMTA